jgi:hypothetical protein
MKKTSRKDVSIKPVSGRDEHKELMRRINEAQQLVQDLKTELRTRKPETPAKLPPRIPLWVLVRDVLRDNDGEAKLQDIIDTLLKDGHDLGKYPLRNLKTMVVSSKMRGIFEVTRLPNGTEMVKLEGTPTYTPTRYRRQS